MNHEIDQEDKHSCYEYTMINILLSLKETENTDIQTVMAIELEHKKRTPRETYLISQLLMDFELSFEKI